MFAYWMRQNPTVCFFVICRRLFIASGLTHGYFIEHQWQSHVAVLVILSMHNRWDLTRKNANDCRHRLWVEYFLDVPPHYSIDVHAGTYVRLNVCLYLSQNKVNTSSQWSTTTIPDTLKYFIILFYTLWFTSYFSNVVLNIKFEVLMKERDQDNLTFSP